MQQGLENILTCIEDSVRAIVDISNKAMDVNNKGAFCRCRVNDFIKRGSNVHHYYKVLTLGVCEL